MEQKIECQYPVGGIHPSASGDSSRLQREFWIALSLAPGFGAHRFETWRQEIPQERWAASLAGLRGSDAWRMAAQIVADAEMHGIRIVAWDDPDYPALLRGSRAALPVIYMQGCWATRPVQPVALVGTRTPSWGGKAVTRALVEALRGHATSVISGLAAGIDLASHRAALDCKIHTVAVLAQGLDQDIPAERGHVAQEILSAGGALVSPFPPGTIAYKGNFLARNALIAGLAGATLVVESRETGGALNTAEHCIHNERRLLAIPGDILRATSQGPNMLIESNEALPVWTPEQFPILCQLDPIPNCELDAETRDSQEFAALFAGEICNLEEILERTGKPLSEVLQSLSALEIDGELTRAADGQYHFLSGRQSIS